jgi:hypothetical protein
MWAHALRRFGDHVQHGADGTTLVEELHGTH